MRGKFSIIFLFFLIILIGITIGCFLISPLRRLISRKIAPYPREIEDVLEEEQKGVSFGSYVSGGVSFTWRKLDQSVKNIKFEIGLSRDYPDDPEYGQVLSNFVMVKADEDFNPSIERDEEGNIKFVMEGDLSEVETRTGAFGETIQEPLTWQPIGEGSYYFPREYPQEFERYLEPGINIQSDNLELKEVADGLVGDINDMYLTAKRIIVSDLFKNMPYNSDKLHTSKTTGFQAKSWNEIHFSALQTYRDNTGICVEKSRLLCALMRAKRIPCRAVTMTGPHQWSEVWINGVGWVAADVTIPGKIEEEFPKEISKSSHLLVKVGGRDDISAGLFDWSPSVLSHFKITKTREAVSKPNYILVHPDTKSVLDYKLDSKVMARAVIPLSARGGIYIYKEGGVYSAQLIDTRSGKEVERLSFKEGDGSIQKFGKKDIEFQPTFLDDYVLLRIIKWEAV